MEKLIDYQEVLTDDEIKIVGKIVDKFENGEINYATLEDEFLKNGITVVPAFRDFTLYKMTSNDYIEFNNRMNKKEYLPGDICYFLLNSEKFKNVVFRMDYKVIELLAEEGNMKYVETYLFTLKTYYLTGEKDENTKAEIIEKIKSLEAKLEEKPKEYKKK